MFAALALAVNVLYAGSLVTPMEGPVSKGLASEGIQFAGEARGSKALERLIESGLRKPDVFISADPALVDQLAQRGLVKSRVTFASAWMVLGYSPRSKQRALFEAVAKHKADLVTILKTPGLAIGRTDPALDPKGVRTQRSLKLLGLPPDLGSEYPEEDLLARLETGILDAAFLYSNESIARGLPAIRLPGPAALSDEITYTLVMMKNAPHPDAAAQFARYLETGKGRAILERAGLIYLTRR